MGGHAWTSRESHHGVDSLPWGCALNPPRTNLGHNREPVHEMAKRPLQTTPRPAAPIPAHAARLPDPDPAAVDADQLNGHPRRHPRSRPNSSAVPNGWGGARSSPEIRSARCRRHVSQHRVGRDRCRGMRSRTLDVIARSPSTRSVLFSPHVLLKVPASPSAWGPAPGALAGPVRRASGPSRPPPRSSTPRCGSRRAGARRRRLARPRSGVLVRSRASSPTPGTTPRRASG